MALCCPARVPGELETCGCAHVWRLKKTDTLEEYPRCHECSKPVCLPERLAGHLRWPWLLWRLRDTGCYNSSLMKSTSVIMELIHQEYKYPPDIVEACCLCYRCILRCDYNNSSYWFPLGHRPDRNLYWWHLLHECQDGSYAGIACLVCKPRNGASVHWRRTEFLEHMWKRLYRWVPRTGSGIACEIEGPHQYNYYSY